MKNNTIWYVRHYFSSNGEGYHVLPYSLEGTLRCYFGKEKGKLKFAISWYPWYARYTDFVKFLWYSRLSKKKAQELCDKLTSELNSGG